MFRQSVRLRRNAHFFPFFGTKPAAWPFYPHQREEEDMLRAGILWMMGVPLFVVILLWYFFF
jgi:hypothetical protein